MVGADDDDLFMWQKYRVATRLFQQLLSEWRRKVVDEGENQNNRICDRGSAIGK